MKTIQRIKLNRSMPKQPAELPFNSRILCVEACHPHIAVWLIRDPEIKTLEYRTFYVVMGYENVDDRIIEMDYIGCAMLDASTYFVFESKNKT